MKSIGTFSPSVSTQTEAKIKNLQGQIDTINESSDVTDVVATYADLQSYDTSSLTDKDIIKVLTDSSHSNKTTYYRYVKSSDNFTYIGAIESYYTKSETNTLLSNKQDTLVSGTNIKTINGDSVLGSGDLSIGITENGWTKDNLVAGTNISITQVPAPIIDQYTKALWNFEDGTNDVIAGYTYSTDMLHMNGNKTPIQPVRSSLFRFGEYSVHGDTYGYYSWNITPALQANGEFTLDLWLKRSTSNPYGYWPEIRLHIELPNSGGYGGNILSITSDGSYFTVGNSYIDLRSNCPFPNDTDWHHIAITFATSTGNVKFFLDGIHKCSIEGTQFTIDLTNNKQVYFVLYNSPTWYFDEIRFSNCIRWNTNFTPFDEPYVEGGSGVFQINNTQDISGKADKDTTLSGYGITDAYTKTEVNTALAAKQNTITGSNGEVVYHNGTGIVTQSILNFGYACGSTAEVNQCKNNAPSFSDVFNTWKKFSHRNATNDAIPSEMTAWTYDSGTDTITQPLNTESYVGFISPKSYSSYDITVRCYSTGSDDDSIGLVAAFAKDSNGLEHTLSFIRSPGGTSAKWVAILDYNQFALTGTSYGQKILVNNSAASTTPASTANWNTESIGTGTVIKMVRSGNVITAKCSQFNSNTIDDNTLITVDLDALSTDNPTLNLFKGASPWGYSNFSQPNSKYENISVTDPDGMIFDIPNNQVLQYSNGTWVVVSGQIPISAIGAGRLSYNSVTGKLFFCTGTDIIQIGTNTDI